MIGDLKLKIILCVILSYLIGSIPSAYLIGKIFFKKDIRTIGSGNVGATNAYRAFGAFAGALTMALDILKGTLGASLPIIFKAPDHHMVLFIGFAAVLGHCFSIFLHFKGGKAVSTSAGILLAYNPVLFLLTFSTFILLVLLTSTVSLASLTTLVLLSITSLFYKDLIFSIVAIVVTIFVFWRHKENIKRLMRNEENIVSFGLIHYLRNKNLK